MRIPLFIAIPLLIICCNSKDNPTPAGPVFTGETKLTVLGYTGVMMEPFLCRNDSILFFNNSNDPAVNTDLHWAKKVNDSVFQYQGELQGVNTNSLDAVATMSNAGDFYFVSTRSYNQDLSTIYHGQFSNGSITGISLASGISKNQAGWVNFDVEVNASGDALYFVDGRFDQNGGPYEADLGIAQKSGSAFQRLPNNADILQQVNTMDLEYAAAISSDDLELYFTRVRAPLNALSVAEIFVATRKNKAENFGTPHRIESITGFAEGPTISVDGKRLYYHKREADGSFSLYLTQRLPI